MLCGAEGQLGRSIPLLNKKKFHIIKYNKNDLDITDKEKVKFCFNKHKPDILINTAAYTKVDKAENEIQKAFDVNSNGVKNLALHCYKHDSLLIHFSTDYIFDGLKSAEYNEKDIPNPVSQYAKSKFAGEKEIINTKCKYLILRVGWLYSHFKTENFLDKMVVLSKKNKKLEIISDQKGRPTSTLELSRNLWEIIYSLKEKNENVSSDIYHFSQNGRIISFFEFAKSIFNYMDTKNNKISLIEPILSRNYNKKSIRPLFSALDNSKLSKTFNLEIENWEKSLSKILDLKFGN